MSASSAATPRANGTGSAQSVVLAQLHLSCFVTAANRATPVFDVQPERRCVRVAARDPRDAGSATCSSGAATGNTSPTAAAAAAAAAAPVSSSGGAGRQSPGAEWEFHSVFSSSTPATHSADFFREVSLSALQHVCDTGLNANIIATGIHPTQKFRLLFGKSTGVGGADATSSSSAVVVPSSSSSSSSSSASDEQLLDAHGQIGALLGEFFRRHAAPCTENASWLRAPATVQCGNGNGNGGGDWHVGISSWVIVNNAAVDLLKTQSASSSRSDAGGGGFTFVCLEAPTLTTALAILQTAKTNRIVMKQSAEHSHFFVRLAFFRSDGGQLSTLHVADLADLKEYRDSLAVQEKREFYDVLHEIRQLTRSRSPPLSPRNGNNAGATSDSSKPSKQPRMVLASFLQPLLTSNAKTFLYVNVIDSRACIRENVALLNAVANLRGFACVCKRLAGVELGRLGFQSFTPTTPTSSDATATASLGVSSSPEPLDSAAAKAMAAVAIGESLLNRLTSAGSSSRLQTERAPLFTALPVDDSVMTAASPAVTADASSWLQAFRQRKQDILAAGSSGPSAAAVHPTPGGSGPSSSGSVPGTSSSDLYARLMESIPFTSSMSASPPLPLTAARSTVRRSSSLPLPIEDPISPANDEDHDEDHALAPLPPPPPPLPAPSPAPASAATKATATATAAAPVMTRCNQSWHDVLEQANLPTQVLPQPNVDGLDTEAARRVQASDAALLRRNYDALLTIVQEQQRLREAAESRAADAVRDHEELRAQHELQIENLKLEVAGLRRKLRGLERQSPAAAVFEHYEQDVESLHREVQQLRALNVQLELRLAGGASESSSDAVAFGNSSAHGSMAELKRRYQAMAEERQALERQLVEYRKRERQFLAQSKLVSDSTRKVDRLARELSAKEETLLAARLGKQRLDAEVQQAQHEAEQLQQENDRLLMEKAATTEELLATKMYLASIESEQKKAEILDRFVRKHGDRMSRLRLTGGTMAAPTAPMLDGESWRRDAQARETEEKLFQSVKRSQPQLVPLVNKVLRKLEMQELSLREYAEREVDFINLLVELVSDQPALTLRQMIESEMRKLSLVT